MARVVIDGIEYLTRAEMPELTVKRLKAALTALVSVQYFSEHQKAARPAWKVLHEWHRS